ncbi:MAG: amidohydrolase family protein [Anaerolineae bacterium]
MKWLDTHIHPSAFDAAGNPRGDVLPDLLTVLDGSGADMHWVVSCDLPETGRARSDPEWTERANAFLRDLCDRSGGRLHGAFLASPQFPDEAERVLRLAAEKWGFVQYGEVLEDVVDWGLTTPEVVRSVEQAAAYDLPVQVHVSTNYEKGKRHMAQLLGLAERVPQARYIVAHAIGGRMTDYYLEVMAPRIARGEGYWLEIRDFDDVPALSRAIAAVGAEHLIAGTDWTNRIGPPHLPYGVRFDVPDPTSPIGRRAIRSLDDLPYDPSVATFVRFLKQAGATPAQIDRIAWANAAELLGLAE